MDALEPLVPSTLVVGSPGALLLRGNRGRVSRSGLGLAVGFVLGRASRTGGDMCNGVLGSRVGYLPLGLGGGRTRWPEHTGVQYEPVTKEPGPWGPRPRSGRVLRKGMELPPREWPTRQGIGDGLGGRLASWCPRAALGAAVTEAHLVETEREGERGKRERERDRDSARDSRTSSEAPETEQQGRQGRI